MKDIYNAKWIKSGFRTESCAVDFSRDFELAGPVKKAVLEITALGVFNAFVNGKKAGKDILAPGWTSYKTRLQYMTYDITSLLKEDSNNITVGVGTGWRFHKVAGWGTPDIKPDGTALLCAVRIEYESGGCQLVLTDETWKCRKSNIYYNNIYNGECCDLSKNPGKFASVSVFHHPKNILLPLEGEPIREQEVLRNPELIITPKNEKVLDFGQEITGYVEFTADLPKGREIVIKHFEVLDKDGCVYTTNLRSAKQEVRVISGGEKFTFKPSYTFYGFRYICIDGIDNIDPKKFKAIAVYSKISRTSTFECSNPMLNRLYSNILWSQRGNFLDVPTDCPQRDERLGWTGDAQVFCKTAAINFNVQKFFDKWLSDLAAEQLPDGSIPNVCPKCQFNTGYNSAAWSDVAVIIPWELYLAYGDKERLRKAFPMMKKWVDKMADCAAQNAAGTGKDFQHPWKVDGHYGDWLALDGDDEEAGKGQTEDGLIATAYLAKTAEIIVKSGKILGIDTSYYEKIYNDAAEFFRSEYMENGRMKHDTQTACVLALHFGLSDNPRVTTSQLVENIRRKGRMTTGFVGAPYILFALSDNGYVDIAYDLLLKEDYPSWLYPITMGATTVWERWNGIHPDGRFANAHMNSFNHYAYGSVFGWMFTNLVGIKTDESAPGYTKIIFAPKPDKRIDHVKGSIKTCRGTAKSEYCLKDGKWEFTITVPHRSHAEFMALGHTFELHPGENIFSLSDI